MSLWNGHYACTCYHPVRRPGTQRAASRQPHDGVDLYHPEKYGLKDFRSIARNFTNNLRV